MDLIACELTTPTALERPRAVRHLREQHPEPLLVLDTCQRLECFGFSVPKEQSLAVSNTWKRAEAFERLSRIAAGLESRILGELEVLGQVRRAYKQFHGGSSRCSRLDRVFQDALSLARRARKESGIDSNLTSLSGIAARTLLDLVPAGRPLAVVGSGSIAGSAARYLGKRGHAPVRVSSRCPDNAMSLAVEVGGFGGGLDDLADLFRGVSGILCATAAPHAVVYPQHIRAAARPLVVVDMAEPADCDPAIPAMDHVHYLSLEDVERTAQVNTEERQARAEVAARMIREGAHRWAQQH